MGQHPAGDLKPQAPREHIITPPQKPIRIEPVVTALTERNAPMSSSNVRSAVCLLPSPTVAEGLKTRAQQLAAFAGSETDGYRRDELLHSAPALFMCRAV